MEPWEDELLWDDDFSDEEEVAEEQIEETGLKMDEDSFADWEDASDGAPVDETLEEALAEERTLELESELEQDEHPRDYNAELEDEEEEAAPTSEKRLKREIRAEALRRLEEAARTESDFLTVVDEWNKLDRNRERRERDYENLRGDVPLEFQAVPDPKIAPLWMNLPRFRQLCQGNFLDIIFSCPYELHELTANRFILPADHGILAHGLQQRFIFLHELALPQRKAMIVFQLFAQMLIHPLLQLFLNGHPQLSDISVGLPSDGGKPCGAVLLDEQVIQHLLLLIAEGEKKLGEKTVRSQLVQLVWTGKKKAALDDAKDG